MNIAHTARQLLADKPFIKQVIKFCMVGGTAAIISFSVYYFAVALFALWYIASAVLSYITAAIFNFFANKFWTFRNKEQGLRAFGQMTKFALVLSSGLLINTLIIYLLTDKGGWDYRLSWVGATGLVTFWNFGFNRNWTFKHKKLPIS